MQKKPMRGISHKKKNNNFVHKSREVQTDLNEIRTYRKLSQNNKDFNLCSFRYNWCNDFDNDFCMGFVQYSRMLTDYFVVPESF